MKSEIDCKGTKSQLHNKSFSCFFSENGKLKHLQRVDVFVEFFIKGVARHGRSIAEDDEFHSGTGNSHIHTAQITEETNLSFIIGSHQRNQDNITFLTLETINSIHADQLTKGLKELFLLQQSTEILYLCPVRRDDTYIDTLVKNTLFAYLIKIGLKGPGSVLLQPC